MTALRQLSMVYVAAAGAYAIAMAMSAHPVWERDASQTAHYLRTHVVATASAFDDHVLRPDLKLAEAAGRALGDRINAEFKSRPTHLAHVPLPPVKVARAVPASNHGGRANADAIFARHCTAEFRTAHWSRARA